ncbi:MAG: hypothetical protein ACRDT2_08540 [Natronosporangium sp.]
MFTPTTWAASVGLVLAALVAVVGPPAAHAPGTATGSEGQQLTVSKASGLAPAGKVVTVDGTGFDENRGIYVAFCVDNGPGAVPTPCGGGADQTGSAGGSHWISSNPPSYGEGLAVPYRDGGSFSVPLPVSARIGEVDCTARTCSVVTRADHTRGADRSQDVRVPVGFATEPRARLWWPIFTGAALLAGLLVAGGVLARRRAAR